MWTQEGFSGAMTMLVGLVAWLAGLLNSKGKLRHMFQAGDRLDCSTGETRPLN